MLSLSDTVLYLCFPIVIYCAKVLLFCRWHCSGFAWILFSSRYGQGAADV